MLKWNLRVAISGMEVGDTFFIPCLNCDTEKRAVGSWGREFGYKLSYRPVTEDYVKGIRVWRVA